MSNERAEWAVRQLCNQHNMTVAQVANYVLYDLARPLPLEMANKLTAVFHAAQRMEAAA